MTRIAAITIALCLTGFAAATEPMLPRCSAELDGQFSEGGCSCAYDRGGILTGKSPGWRWKCDLLRGPGPTAPMIPAGQPAPSLPPGFTYSPRTTTNLGNTGTGSTSTGNTSTGSTSTGITSAGNTSTSGASSGLEMHY